MVRRQFMTADYEDLLSIRCMKCTTFASLIKNFINSKTLYATNVKNYCLIQ